MPVPLTALTPAASDFMSACTGDRPIEITLQRAWQALTWPQRARLLGLLLQSRSVDTSELSAQAVEALKDDDVIESVVAEYSQKFPQVRHGPHALVERSIVRAFMR